MEHLAHSIVHPHPRLESRPGSAPVRRHLLDVSRLPDHRDRLYRAAYAMCRSREDAEDLVQETFARVLRKPRLLWREDDLGYLLKVLRNTWISGYAAQARRPRSVEFDEEMDWVLDPAAGPDVAVTELDAIYAAVRELSPPLRDTIIAVDVLGLSYKQAAGALRTGVGTVMSRLHRARAKAAELLERSGALT
jgi:RNA polymerase sigma-70 factor (ECF subfamily)